MVRIILKKGYLDRRENKHIITGNGIKPVRLSRDGFNKSKGDVISPDGRTYYSDAIDQQQKNQNPANRFLAKVPADIAKEDRLEKKAAILGRRKGKSITGGLLMADPVTQQPKSIEVPVQRIPKPRYLSKSQNIKLSI